jgi:hypothetical protein
MSTPMNRTHPARPRACTGCQVGQGRNCKCRTKRRELTVTEATWLVIVCNTAFLVALGRLAGWL